MDTDRLKGAWHQVKGAVRLQWAKLTDDDLEAVDGDSERLKGRIQERYGYNKDRAREEYERWHDQQSW